MNDESARRKEAAAGAAARGEVPGATACACGAEANEPELMKRLDGVLADYRGKPGALIPVLQIAQGIFGYLPENVIKHIALALGKSYSEVAGVVGFYSFFSTHPRGKHLVRVCLGTACYVRGGKQVLETCRQELGVDVGETTKDGVFSLEVARCFGACGLAPTIMIDEDVHQRVKPQRLREIFAGYRNGKSAAAAKPAAKRAVKKAAPGAGPRSAVKTTTKAKPKRAAGKAAPSRRAAGVKTAARKAGGR